MKPDCLAADELVAKMVAVAEAKAVRSLGTTFLLSALAGLFVGLGASYMLIVRSDSTLSFAAAQLLGGLSFCLGLFLILVAGAELFTGNTLMVMGRLSGRFGWRSMLVRWLVVYAGNLVGSLVLVALVTGAQFTSMNEGNVARVAVEVAAMKAGLPWGVAFCRGILCNALVCLAVWMGNAGKSVADKLCATILPVCAFMGCGFEHSVANMYFLPLGLVNLAAGAGAPGSDATLNLAGVLSNLSAVTLGNIVGGALLVGASYWIAYGRSRA